MTPETQIYQLSNAISDAHAAKLMDACDLVAATPETIGSLPEPRTIYRHRIPGEAGIIVDVLAEQVLEASRRLYNLPLHLDTVILSRIGAGESQERHADCSKLDESGRWVPNHTPQRTTSAVLYLNSDFDGGELVFDQLGLLIKPFKGLLLIWPAGRYHTHQVLTVQRGFRYTLVLWSCL
jgi:predicted 2-oxoglutarate/Fe(II)-dependent dioxygenase YbiX